MPGARCTHSPVCKRLEAHERSRHRFTGTPSIPCTMVLTAYFELSPVIGLYCHRHWRDAKHHRQLDAGVEASGPHDFAVREYAVRPRKALRSGASRPSHSIPRS
jgi:hypothetical protein